MARFGFIHDKLDIKFLILYLMSRCVAPIPFSTLTDLTLCDDGVDYFEFAEAVSELVDTDHLTLEEGRYAITDKGTRNGAICESSLSYSIRIKCDKNIARLNAILRRDAQVRATVSPREDGAFTLQLALDDNGGNLMNLELFVATQPQADQLAQQFLDDPSQVYNNLLSVLLKSEESEP